MNEETKKPEEDRAKEAKEEKKKKINRFTLEELGKKIQEVKEKMGGLTSSYAQELLKRKEQLLQKPEDKEQKTEETEKLGGDSDAA